MIPQHRQGETLVLTIGPPRAGLETLTKARVCCVKEVGVVKVRVSGGGGGGSEMRQVLNHDAPWHFDWSPFFKQGRYDRVKLRAIYVPTYPTKNTYMEGYFFFSFPYGSYISRRQITHLPTQGAVGNAISGT